MAEIKLKSNQTDEEMAVLSEALKTEERRLSHALEVANKRINHFEQKYNIFSDNFIKNWSSEDLPGGDLEYVDWAGEIKLASRIKERLAVLKNVEYVD